MSNWRRRLLVTLMALSLIGCGGADKMAPSSPAQTGSGSYGDMRAQGAPVKAEAYSAPGMQATSPSMAGNYAPPAERPMRGSMRESDADGVLDKGGGAPAPAAPPPAAPKPEPGEAKKPDSPDPSRAVPGHDSTMLVYTATINLAVYLVDQAISQVEAIAKDSGGFLSSRGDNQIVIRVPRSRFQAALAAIEKTGDVLHRDVRAEDVTDAYMDLEVRIKNARAMRDQLAALLQKANVKEALEIERELGRVTEELERMEGQLKLLRDKIAYSTITVTYAARGSTIQANKVRLPFPWLSSLGLPGLLRLEDNK
jgi:hypothetical protein